MRRRTRSNESGHIGGLRCIQLGLTSSSRRDHDLIYLDKNDRTVVYPVAGVPSARSLRSSNVVEGRGIDMELNERE